MAGHCMRCYRRHNLGHRDPDNHQWYCEDCWQDFCGKRRLCNECRIANDNGSVDLVDQRWYCAECWSRRPSVPAATPRPGTGPNPVALPPSGPGTGATSPAPLGPGGLQPMTGLPLVALPMSSPPSSNALGTPVGPQPMGQPPHGPWGHGPPPPMMHGPPLLTGLWGPAPMPGMPTWHVLPPAPGFLGPGCHGPGMTMLSRPRSRSPYRGGGQKLPEARKYTCRFIIGIESDDEFRVVRRIIGAGGAKMKDIVARSGGEAKLRLRGRGSGYVERDIKTESNEPLQLCISCPHKDGYVTAVRCTEELLRSVYDSYSKWCADRGTQVATPQIRFTERHQLGGRGGRDGSPTCADASSVGGDGPVALPKKRRGGARGRRLRAKAKAAPVASGAVSSTGAPPTSDGPPVADANSVPVAMGECSGSSLEDNLRSKGPRGSPPSVEEIERRIAERNEARKYGNFAEADRIREDLRDAGVVLSDEKGGKGPAEDITTWRYWQD